MAQREFYMNNEQIGIDQFVIDTLLSSVLQTDKEACFLIYEERENYIIDTFNHGNMLTVRYNGSFIELSFKLYLSTKTLTVAQVHEYLIDLSKVILCGVNVLQWV